ncbi:MAG: hypothetical protein M1423_01975 [Acidobacteria bacterium]|nr:hypothetical protein [Acidobacteriota bacterium]
MNRRNFLGRSAAYAFLTAGPQAWLEAQGLRIEQGAPTPLPIPEPHFPDRIYLFIWRNWELANLDRIAKVLGTTAEKVREIGASMGLPPKPQLTLDQLRRISTTVIRQNWHILPDGQLMELLGWDRQRYEYALREDDFLWIKLGRVRPRCDHLRYKEPSAAARSCAARIKRLVREVFQASLDDPGEPPFQFVTDLSSTGVPLLRDPQSRSAKAEVDLSREWRLSTPARETEIPARLVEDFASYLRKSYGCDLTAAGSPRVFKIGIDRSLAITPGSFHLSVQPEAIHLVGRDVEGVRQGLDYLRNQMEERGGPYLATGSVQRATHLNPRYAYSYFALYGDPLMETDIDPFPDGFLEKVARAGVNGVWLQAVLRNMAPSTIFPEFGAGSQIRLKNLARLAKRAADYGVKIYLYLNEPRAMPARFFAKHPGSKGTHDPDEPEYFAMCTSTPEVREWLSNSLAHIFAEAPGLGGIFCITASENLTNCYSHGRAQYCPRCSKRTGAEVIAEVITTFRDGVRQSSRHAEVIAWDWGWGYDWIRNGAHSAGVIERLPKDVALLSVSEWGQPVNRGGVHTKVNEYSISVVGPGPRALRNWRLARKQGLQTMAKVQWSATWEISAVPYIPVPNLIVEHCQNLLKTDVRGLMASWTVGGYPSPNFEVAQEFYFSPPPSSDQALGNVARRRYGSRAAPAILEAWTIFSKAFENFPFGVAIYTIPTQHGPANPLRLYPTGYKASMMLFPYDDYKTWAGAYPVETVEEQFAKMARAWEAGLKRFREALALVPAGKRALAQKDLGIAEVCHLHFQSVTHQVRFYLLRARLETGAPESQKAVLAQMIEIAKDEIELARREYAIARHNSTIGYEASNEYYFRPLDLVEKVLNCHQVIEEMARLQSSAKFSPAPAIPV